MPPHPSPDRPHDRPSCWQVCGVHPPHWFGVPPPPHVCPLTQVPHDGVSPPHPSATCPQFAFACWHVRGEQVGGVTGGRLSCWMQFDRSNSMNSSAFSC